MITAVTLTMTFLSEALLAFAGLIAGYIDTLAGGSGLITLPAYLMFGLPPHFALGTNKLSSTMCVANAAAIFIRKKIFYPRYWPACIIATFFGGIAGSILVLFVSSTFLRKLLPFIIIALGIYVALPKKYAPLTHLHYRPKLFSSGILGGFLGFYDGFIGPGAGSFWVVGLMAIYKIPMVEATAIAKLMNFLSNIAALIIFMVFGRVHYLLGLIVGIAMMVGSFLGAHSAIRWGAEFVRPIFLVVVFGIAALLFWQTYANLLGFK